MDNLEALAAKRFKSIRDQHQLTQKQFADNLGIKNNIADIERGRTKITGYTVAMLTKSFGINPLWLYGLSAIKEIRAQNMNVSPKLVTVDSTDNENMVLVDVKASAGYPSNIQEPHWYHELPAFNFPLPEFRNASFRGFQIQGDSMFPTFKPKEWVIGKAIDTINDVSNNRIHVIVLKDSVLIKKVSLEKQATKAQLISLNTLYPPIEININEIQEIWEVTSKLSFDINSTEESASIHDLQLAIQRLGNEVSALKNG